MTDENIDSQIRQQTQRKLQEHLEKLRKYGGVPPKEEEPQPAPSQQQAQEQANFRNDWNKWKKVYGGRIIDLRARKGRDKTADFKLLGIAPTGNKEEIRKAYYAQAKRNHPDVGGDPEKFLELMTAYQNLTGEV
ncbi:MAG: J domain-containing protein [SAR324 cluster bacterium]|nr:J domain-containing protein [SAR324 cluster bacterium]MCZ6532830.1 J domain-containing protein [SAR324 cluster bacterium]MCZ6558138.1 J domain-containing protein [SAR324 cluster bacterium]MCZ6627898.1 J domain-containing protein [SAR324 cluster bacterium]MCZ6645344.1 J domain-containing protein [SAR324 cluster bacterium]